MGMTDQLSAAGAPVFVERPARTDMELVRAHSAIVRLAQDCEKCLRLAAFADAEPMLSSGIADSLRKYAAVHAEEAVRWSRRVIKGRR